MQDTDTYDPYGNLTASTGSVQDHLLFQGQYLDSENGLYYLRARYYDPCTGQFLTVDPDVATTHSPYAYVLGDPLNSMDPLGLSPSEYFAWCYLFPNGSIASDCRVSPWNLQVSGSITFQISKGQPDPVIQSSGDVKINYEIPGYLCYGVVVQTGRRFVRGTLVPPPARRAQLRQAYSRYERQQLEHDAALYQAAQEIIDLVDIATV